MNYRMIFHTLGAVLACLAVLMLLPLLAGLCYGENVLAFVIAIGITAAVSFILRCFKPRSTDIYAREGFVIVGLAWISMSLLGALPFVISGQIPNYIDAVFETVSGFTTTGASILTDIEGMSHACLFWRSFTHWIGGMGVLVFVMAVLPMSGEHSMHIMRAEVPGPTVGKLVPRAKETAKILYLMYMALTALETIFLKAGGMSFFDALLHAFGTAGTGGFSTKAASVGAFNSLYVEMVISVFMLLFSVNFNLYYLLLIGRLKDVLKNEELHWFLAIVLFCVLTIAVNISSMYGSFATALRHAFFNVSTIISTTGFGTVDFNLWPQYSKWLLILLMFIGACAGSTGGGMKVSRLIMLLKSASAELRQMIRPRSVTRVQLEGKRVETGAVHAVSTFFVMYVMILLVCTLLISVDGFDMETNFTGALACLSNIGPGMSLVGPTGNYSLFSAFSKIVLSLAMLIGRLEIYPILLLFNRHTWKR